MRRIIVGTVALSLVAVVGCDKSSDNNEPNAQAEPIATAGQRGGKTMAAVAPHKAKNPAKPRQTGPAKLKPLPWLRTSRAAFAAAKKARKGVMIDFSAAWCMPCRELDKTFATPAVRSALLAKFVPVKFDVTQSTAIDTARMAKYGVKTLPAVLFLSADGKLKHRIRTLIKPAALVALIAKLKVKRK